MQKPESGTNDAMVLTGPAPPSSATIEDGHRRVRMSTLEPYQNRNAHELASSLAYTKQNIEKRRDEIEVQRSQILVQAPQRSARSANDRTKLDITICKLGGWKSWRDGGGCCL